MTLDPEEAGCALAACETPFIIGVRHHSPACSAVMDALLDAFQPQTLLVELPVELAPWIPWIAHPETEPPVALAGGRPGHEAIYFYPFADFSPELVAMRWASAHGVEVVAIDRPLAARESNAAPNWQQSDSHAGELVAALCATAGASDSEDLWDRMVEARAPGAAPEEVRRAALLSGWALRVAELHGPGIREEDLLRETFMRERIREASAGRRRITAVVGAFHAAALLPQPMLYREADAAELQGEQAPLQTALVPYAFELLDSRSGYPAGIRDPAWQERLLRALPAPEAVEGLVAEMAVEVCRQLRSKGHVAGLPDAQETVRLARDLARLRGLAAAGRQELLESLQSTLTHGEIYGRGRAVAAVLETVMVGRRRGRVASAAPRCGLVPHVLDLLDALRLPSAPQPEAKRLRLDPLRSSLDRRRHVALSRLGACGVPYATLEEGLRAESLTALWTIEWTVSTEAALALNSARGVTLEQASAGALQSEHRRRMADGALLPADRIALTRAFADCGLSAPLETALGELGGALVEQASLAELVSAYLLIQEIDHGHIAGCPRVEVPPTDPGAVRAFALPLGNLRGELLAAAVRGSEGLMGSERIEDAHALAELCGLLAERDEGERGRFKWLLGRLAEEGAPLMQGAAYALQHRLEELAAGTLGLRVASWLDAPHDAAGMGDLAARLRGFLAVAGPQLEANPALLEPLVERIEALTDQRFLRVLPALRHGFEELSPAARSRLLAEIALRLSTFDPDAAEQLALDPQQLARLRETDLVGQAAIPRFALVADGGDCAPCRLATQPPGTTKTALSTPQHDPGSISPADRWRLILGREQRQLSASARRLGRSLDELYGCGSGEGSAGGAGGGAGQEGAFPLAREWAEELKALFGESVREEVLGRAAAAGRNDVLLALDPEAVSPSVELLQQLLSLKGGLPESHLPQLRRIVQRVIDQLVRELATRLQPAMFGLTSARPTRRRGGPLDLRRTINANLRTTRLDESGKAQVVAERLFFRSRGRRSCDWRVVLLVDVSGSMEPSVIYSAMMAAILAGLPAVSLNFVTFSTEVIDLSAHVHDPLGLLLEVQVGGGTHIAKALRYARQLITVPQRTLLLVVSDFDEGWPLSELLGEVQALVESGVIALGLAALDDRGKARYNHGAAQRVVAAGMPVAALSPLELARWVAEQIHRGAR